MSGQKATAIVGSVATQGGSKVPVVLYIPPPATRCRSRSDERRRRRQHVRHPWRRDVLALGRGQEPVCAVQDDLAAQADPRFLVVDHRGVANPVPPLLQAVQGDIAAEEVDAVVNAANRHCAAEAASTAPSTARPERSACTRPAGPSAGARPVRPWPPTASPFPPAGSSTPWDPSGTAGRPASPRCLPPVTATRWPSPTRWPPPGRLPRHRHRRLRLSPAPGRRGCRHHEPRGGHRRDPHPICGLRRPDAGALPQAARVSVHASRPS